MRWESCLIVLQMRQKVQLLRFVERVSERVMRNIAEQTAEAATNAKVCLSGNIGNETACHNLAHLIIQSASLARILLFSASFKEVNSNPAFP